MSDMQKKADYKEINTPSVIDRKLWEKSGHWDNIEKTCLSLRSTRSMQMRKE